MDEIWILEDFDQALTRLEEALATPSESELVKAGCIQYFEFCFELSWKAIKIVSPLLALPDCLSPKACLKLAFAQGWIGNELKWLEMLEARNRMSHTYDAKEALKIYDGLVSFLPEFRKLLSSLMEVSESD